MATKTEWSAKDDKRLRLLYEAWEGDVIPVNAIAEALKRTPSAVRYRASKLGLTEPHRPRAARGRTPTVVMRTCAHCQTEFPLKSPSSTQQSCSRSCAALQRSQATSGRFSGRSRVGRADDLGDQWYRSSWERNIARDLNHLQAKGEIRFWEYEIRRFFFPVKRGNKSYLPDFRVWYPDGSYEWWEVKGFLDNDSKIKLRRFALHHTEESLKLRMIDRPVYMEIKKEFEHILEGWE